MAPASAGRCCGSRLREYSWTSVPVLVREQPDAVELALEQPVGSAEAVLRQRGGHRLEPVGHFRGGCHQEPDDIKLSGSRA